MKRQPTIAERIAAGEVSYETHPYVPPAVSLYPDELRELVAAIVWLSELDDDFGYWTSALGDVLLKLERALGQHPPPDDDGGW